MQHEFEILLLGNPSAQPLDFKSITEALEYARKICAEDENVAAQIIVTCSERDLKRHMSCPMHGIVDYLENFKGLLPASPSQRHVRSLGTVVLRSLY